MKAELGFELGTVRAQSQAFPSGPRCLLWAMSGFWEEHVCFFPYQKESGRKTEIMAEFLRRKFNISIYIKQKKKKPGEKNYRKQLSPPGKRLGYQSLGAWRGPWSWSLDTVGWEGHPALWVLLSWCGRAGSGVMSPKSGLWAPPQYIA